MRKCLSLFVALLALALLVPVSFEGAGTGNTITLTASGAPTGSCSVLFRYIDSATGNEYNCKAGTWNLVGGGGGGTISGLTANVVPKAATATTLANSSITDNLVVTSTELIRGLNSCRVTGDITLSTSATNVCSFSLPASALGWAWHCDILWTVTAGTTPTIAIGVNASQTPTGTTNGYAQIKTTNANVATEGTAAISASGAINLLTSPTLTVSATVFSADSSGTLLASGTAGTFAITMTGTGASFAGKAKAGTACYLY